MQNKPKISDGLKSELAMLRGIATGDWLDTIQVARLLSISPSSLEKARSSGRGPYAALSYHKVGRLVRYKRSDVAAFLDAGRVVGTQRVGSI